MLTKTLNNLKNNQKALKKLSNIKDMLIDFKVYALHSTCAVGIKSLAREYDSIQNSINRLVEIIHGEEYQLISLGYTGDINSPF